MKKITKHILSCMGNKTSVSTGNCVVEICGTISLGNADSNFSTRFETGFIIS